MNTPAVANGLRMGVALGMAGLIVLAVSGCGGDVATPGAGGSGTASAAPQSTMLTGAKLKSLLLPASAMPKGLRLSADGARNTGVSVAPRATEPVVPGKVCPMFQQTAWIRASGISPATFAQNDYVDAGQTSQFAQEIDTFHGTDARTVMSKLRKAFAGCTAFVEKSDGVTAKTKLVKSTLPGVRDEGIKAVMTSPTYQGGVTLAAIRVGNTVVTILYSSTHGKGTAGVKMAESIAQNVQHAR
jgi:hypothetical protein